MTALAAVGTDLYVGGAFTDAGGISVADYIVRWNGSTWSNLGTDLTAGSALDDAVWSLAAFDSVLVVGGAFADAADIPTADHLALWDGGWGALGSNGAGDGAINRPVFAMALTSEALYIGGRFNDVGDAAGDFVTKWNGSTWSGLGAPSALRRRRTRLVRVRPGRDRGHRLSRR